MAEKEKEMTNKEIKDKIRLLTDYYIAAHGAQADALFLEIRNLQNQLKKQGNANNAEHPWRKK